MGLRKPSAILGFNEGTTSSFRSSSSDSTENINKIGKIKL
jgi:hypothetical protein